MIVDQRFDPEDGFTYPEHPDHSTLVFPAANAYCLFDGGLGHGVLDCGLDGVRTTFLVNWWERRPQVGSASRGHLRGCGGMEGPGARGGCTQLLQREQERSTGREATCWVLALGAWAPSLRCRQTPPALTCCLPAGAYCLPALTCCLPAGACCALLTTPDADFVALPHTLLGCTLSAVQAIQRVTEEDITQFQLTRGQHSSCSGGGDAGACCCAADVAAACTALRLKEKVVGKGEAAAAVAIPSLEVSVEEVEAEDGCLTVGAVGVPQRAGWGTAPAGQAWDSASQTS